MSFMAFFSGNLLCVNNRNSVGEKETKCLIDLVVSIGCWENSMVREKKLDLLRLVSDTIHGSTGQINL